MGSLDREPPGGDVGAARRSRATHRTGLAIASVSPSLHAESADEGGLSSQAGHEYIDERRERARGTSRSAI